MTLLRAVFRARVEHMSFVNAGMRWAIDGDEYDLGDYFFTWIESVSNGLLFKDTGCIVAVPMMDIAITDSPIVCLLRQWQYQRPKCDDFCFLGKIGGVRGQTYPLW